MKKLKTIIFFVVAFTSVFFIYKLTTRNSTKIYYIALGDSLAAGMNSYGEINYGYSDYIADYLKDNGRLSFYAKDFAKSGYTTYNLKSDIENNKTLTIDNQTVSIREALRESDLVTISIGANNFLKNISFNNITSRIQNVKVAKREVDTIADEVEDLIEHVKKYAKGQIVLIGYYNPLPALTSFKQQIDDIVKYSNNLYNQICLDEQITCLDIFDGFNKEGSKYLPNALDIHPNTKGYEYISKEVIKIIK